MSNELQQLFNLLKANLYAQAPVLSGNLKNGIKVVNVEDNEITIEIEAKFYDTNEFRKTGKINYTGKNYGGITDYAMWLNNLGAFGTGNKSKNWTNRVCYETCDGIAKQIQAEIINELPL